MIRIRTLSAAVLVVLLLAALVAVPAHGVVPSIPERVTAYSVLPPGANGFIHLGHVTSGVVPAHTLDQLDMYASLTDDADVAGDELLTYFKPAELVPGTIDREYQPATDVTVARDAFGVPHVYGDTDAALAFGLGYVTAEDRLWQIDVFRHAAKGEVASLLGPDYAAFDADQRRLTYTDAELTAMIDDTATRFGTEGVKLRSLIESYVDGINERIAEVRLDPLLRPAEYTAQGLEVADWDTSDVAAVAVFQERTFGLTSGAELENAALLQHLRRLHGRSLGTRMFRDLQWRDDPNSPTTIAASQGEFADQALPASDPDAVAIPDRAGQVARAARSWSRVTRTLGLGSGRMSNMISVHGSRSTSGNPLGFGAPQVGYAIPQYLIEIAGHSPSFDFHGAALPGASLFVVLGRGLRHAWSLTTGGSDASDVRAELLCEPDGGTPTQASTHYMYEGECLAMEQRTETIEVRGGEAREETFLRTVHGPVFATGTVGGEPVAFSLEMRFWMRELDTVYSVMKMNMSATDTVEEFREAASHWTVSLNATYEDAENIAFFHMGVFPLRAPGVDTMLPSWGTGEWEWQGTIPFAEQPQLVNPAAGYFVNWNNQPAVGWDNGDSSLWGPTHG